MQTVLSSASFTCMQAGWFIANWLSVLLVGLVGQSIGYIFGAGFGSLQQAQTAATVSMLTFVLCSGFWIKGVPSWLEWVKCASAAPLMQPGSAGS